MEKFTGLLRVCTAKIRNAFPEQQIYFRSNGNVRYIRLSSRAQLMALASAVALVGTLTAVGVSATVRHFELSRREQRVEALESDITAMASRIESRQQALLALMNQRLGPTEGTRTASASASARDMAMTTAAVAPALAGQSFLPGSSDASAELQRYRSYEQQQLALIRDATLAAETRVQQTEDILRKLGINSRRLINLSPAPLHQTGLGGPLVAADLDEAGAPFTGAFESPFRKLIASWNKLDSLERASLSIPAIIPVKSYEHSSGYGYRHDPFTGGGAFHTGVDLSGRYGEPVVAAAGGTVTRAAWWGAYGQMVEIDHGRGLVTRYGHLSSIKAKPGQKVAPGTVIGLMGSTGRSTGTHLHYEVRFEDRALNPLPFLKASADLRAIQQRALSTQG
ncbi:peptidoglycan DD-metalloendopeptidase family protein [Pedomonas sp. V897]|uniref:peptidoglycan DD-metalloendopeptidase family protein n=1 Tax=Pedomonas sp. V897 TaxID=3446482 RepID=UPI003EE26DAC